MQFNYSELVTLFLPQFIITVLGLVVICIDLIIVSPKRKGIVATTTVGGYILALLACGAHGT